MNWELLTEYVIELKKENEGLRRENEQLQNKLDAMTNRALIAEPGLQCKNRRETNDKVRIISR